MRQIAAIFIFIAMSHISGFSQTNAESTYSKETENRLSAGIRKKYDSYLNQTDQETTKFLCRISKYERKLKKKLQKFDSVSTEKLFGNVSRYYDSITKRLNKPISEIAVFKSDHLIRDSLLKSLLCLKGIGTGITDKINVNEIRRLIGQVNELQGKLKNFDDIQNVLKERQLLIREKLQQFGLAGKMKAFDRNLSSYIERVEAIRDMWDEPTKIEMELLAICRKIPAVQEFLNHVSVFATVNQTSIANGAGALAGLQTRSAVFQSIGTQLNMPGLEWNSLLENLGASADEKLNELVQGSGFSGDVIDVRGKELSPVKKMSSFGKKFEYGTNLQSQYANRYFPTTTDIALQIGYRINSRSVVGIGASFKIGLGESIRRISFSTQGMGVRSYVDWKLKGSFFVSGGYEYNYQPVNITTAGNNDRFFGWTKSGLLGVSKIVSIKSRFFKKTKLQLLWDFFSYRQIPQTPAIKFRIGYNF